MDKKHKGKDISFKITLTTNGQNTSLVGRELRIEILPPSPTANIIVINDYVVNVNQLSFVFRGTQQRHLGVHMVRIWENYGKSGQTVVDVRKAVELVNTTEEETSGTDNDIETTSVDLETVDMTLGVAGRDGVGILNITLVSQSTADNGENRYRINLTNNTSYEFVTKNGSKGSAFTYDDYTEEQIAELQKPATDAATAAQQSVSGLVANINSQVSAITQNANSNMAASKANAENAIAQANERLKETIDSITLLDSALKEIYRSGGTIHANSQVTISGTLYYISSTTIQLNKGDVLDVTCKDNQGTVILNASRSILASSSAGKHCEYKATADMVVYVGTVGNHVDGCTYIVRQLDGIIDKCVAATQAANQAAANYDALVARIAALEAKVN